jgi:transcriptional regulator GlxA family with amidase domain
LPRGLPLLDARLRRRQQDKNNRLPSAGCLHSNCTNEELAAYAGLTTRALQQLFLKHFNTTPTAYVHEQRLAEARKELRDPDNKKTVTRVASDLEFRHLGRFATAYRNKFGESPSETSRKADSRNARRHKPSGRASA